MRLDVLRRRIPLRVTVDRRRRGEDDAHAGGRRGLEHPLRREHVPAQILREVVAEARAHAGLPGEVEHAVRAADERGDVVLREVGAHDVQAGRVLLLQRRVVVVVERVDADDLVAGGVECLAQMRPDEAGGSGDEVSHATDCRPDVRRM